MIRWPTVIHTGAAGHSTCLVSCWTFAADETRNDLQCLSTTAIKVDTQDLWSFTLNAVHVSTWSALHHLKSQQVRLDKYLFSCRPELLIHLHICSLLLHHESLISPAKTWRQLKYLILESLDRTSCACEPQSYRAKRFLRCINMRSCFTGNEGETDCMKWLKADRLQVWTSRKSPSITESNRLHWASPLVFHVSKAALLFCGSGKNETQPASTDKTGWFWKHIAHMCAIFSMCLFSFKHQINSVSTGSVPLTRGKQERSGLTDKCRKWSHRFHTRQMTTGFGLLVRLVWIKAWILNITVKPAAPQTLYLRRILDEQFFSSTANRVSSSPHLREL